MAWEAPPTPNARCYRNGGAIHSDFGEGVASHSRLQVRMVSASARRGAFTPLDYCPIIPRLTTFADFIEEGPTLA